MPLKIMNSWINVFTGTETSTIKAEKFSTKYHQWLGGYKKADEYNKGPGEESQH